MTNKEFTRIKRELKPFQRLFLTVACLGLLSSCGGGGSGDGSDVATGQSATKQIAAASGGTVPAGWVGRVPINSSGDIPFDRAYFVTTDDTSQIDQAKGYVSNQFWITSTEINKDTIYKSIIQKGKLSIKAYREGMFGYLVEIDKNDAESIFQLNFFKDNPSYSVFNRVFTGKNSRKDFGYVLENGLELDADPANWHFRYINLSSAWGLTRGSVDQLIGVIDNGFYPTHDQLSGKIKQNYTVERGEHGTAVLSTIAGKPDANALVSGVNWNAKFVVGSNRSDQPETTSTYIKILKENSAVKTISNSWGEMPSCKVLYDYTLLIERKIIKCPTPEEGIKYTRAYRNIASSFKDVVHVWAAGNNGEDARTQNGALHFNDAGEFSPLSNVIVVGAVLKSGELADYSDFGISVDVAAPTEIKAARNPDGIYYFVDQTGVYGTNRDPSGTNYNNSGVGEFCKTGRNCPFGGTSASAPIVSGVISLMLNVNPTLSPAEIKSILIGTSKKSVTSRSYYDGSNLKSKKLDDPIPVIDAEAAVKEALVRKKSFSDDFNGTTLDSTKWNSTPCNASFGDPTVIGGMARFDRCQTADTRGKFTVSGNKIVIEARFAGQMTSGRDSNIALVDPVTGGFLQIGDTNYSDINGSGVYVYLYNGSSYDVAHRYGGSTSAFKEYRITIEGKNVTIERGDSLANLTEKVPVTLPRAVTGGSYYLRIGTGGGDGIYSPADFDWIRVTTDATNPLNGHRYEVIDCGSWSQCQMAAVLRGGKLATIRSKAENDWIVSTLLPMSKNEWGLWIGYTNAGHEGSWTWNSGESASYTNWAPGEPNNSGGAEHYAHILNVASNPGSWNDLYENGFGYVSQAIIEYSK